MTMQHNIDIVRRNFRRNMGEAELHSLAFKIDNQRPVLIPITISTNNRQRWTDCFKIERDRRFANISQMPNLVRVARKIDDMLRQLVMRVRENEYFHSTESRTSSTTGTKFAILNFVVTFVGFVRGLSPNNVI